MKKVNRSHRSLVKSGAHSFVMSNKSDLLLGIKKGRTMKNCQKYTKKFFLSKSLVFCEQKSNLLVKKSKSFTLVFNKVQREQLTLSRPEKKLSQNLMKFPLLASVYTKSLNPNYF